MKSAIACAIIRGRSLRIEEKMLKTMNLSSNIKNQLPAELVDLMQAAGAIASYQGQHLYLVGGVVRDLLLGEGNLDLDLVVEGDAINLAHQLANIISGKITTHNRFKTAKLQWRKWSIDLTTARSETYDKPGALPRIKPGSLADDLFRRDFTINTMAIRLNPAQFGKLIDRYGGRDDLEHRLIRILHEKSFTDDATRIWRGLRYEQRLDFHLEPDTLRLLKRDIPMLDTISGDRIRYELEMVLREKLPEKVLSRAAELKVLPKLHPDLKGNNRLAERFEQARRLSPGESPPVALYLALLGYSLTVEAADEFITRLRFPKILAQALRDTSNLKTKLEVLANPGLSPSSVYATLKGHALTAIRANLLTNDSPVVSNHIRLFLDRLRYIKPALSGDDLQGMGISPGPQIKEILNILHEARLDGKVTGKEGEKDLVIEWLQHRA